MWPPSIPRWETPLTRHLPPKVGYDLPGWPPNKYSPALGAWGSLMFLWEAQSLEGPPPLKGKPPKETILGPQRLGKKTPKPPQGENPNCVSPKEREKVPTTLEKF